ncbi:MAG: CoA-transferase [Planctomycetota bacterium]
MAAILPLSSAIADLIHDGDEVAFEGFTHLIPFAAGHELIRQRRKNLTLVRLTPDLIYDQMIGMGCAKKVVFSWGGNPGVGSLHRLRDAVENRWPTAIECDERSHAAMAAAYVAGASGLPMAVLRGFRGSDLADRNPNIKFIDCPFSGEELAAVPSIQPDVSVIHAQKADKQGNVLLWGIVGVQKEITLAAKRTIVTVEEIVDSLDPWPNALVLPSWTVTAVCLAPGGAAPSYADGYYKRDNNFYTAWDKISRSREKFQQWMERHVLNVADHTESRRLVRDSLIEEAV